VVGDTQLLAVSASIASTLSLPKSAAVDSATVSDATGLFDKTYKLVSSASLAPTAAVLKSVALVATAEIAKTEPLATSASIAPTGGLPKSAAVHSTTVFDATGILDKTYKLASSASLAPTVAVIKSAAVDSALVFYATGILDNTYKFASSASIAPTVALVKSVAAIGTADIEKTEPPAPSASPAPTNGAPKSNPFDATFEYEGTPLFRDTTPFTPSEVERETLALKTSREIGVSDLYTPSQPPLATPPAEGSGIPIDSGEWVPSAAIWVSVRLARSILFGVTSRAFATLGLGRTPTFHWSKEWIATAQHLVSEAPKKSKGFPDSRVFQGSNQLPNSGQLLATSAFSPSDKFTASPEFDPTAPFTKSETPTKSREFSNSQARDPIVIPGEQQGWGAVAGGLAGGAAALLALLGLILIIVLRRRKKPEVDEVPEEETVVSEIDTIDERNEFISEYGMSDHMAHSDDLHDGTDLPQVVSSGDLNEGNLIDGASEHNPDDFVDDTGEHG
jgi:hypothetical protein